LINIPIPPNQNQDLFGNVYSSNQTQWRYKRNNVLMVDKLISTFKGLESTNLYLNPIHINIDTKNNMSDGVHPATSGYNQTGDITYYTIKALS
jgi:hypothetical protein